MNNLQCDPETGICSPSELTKDKTEHTRLPSNQEIIYVGDPMCSWCWGISPDLKKLRDHYKTQGIGFKIVVGGLRPGGGDPWNDQMKDFLKHHWEEVNERTGQPFGYTLFEKDTFNYDTEPSCRAVVAARRYLFDNEFEFFEAIQYKFYVNNEDPKQVSFYKSICGDFNIDFDSFKLDFESDSISKETYKEFYLNREWGVKGYPSIIFRKDSALSNIAYGYSTFEEMRIKIDLLRK